MNTNEFAEYSYTSMIVSLGFLHSVQLDFLENMDIIIRYKWSHDLTALLSGSLSVDRRDKSAEMLNLLVTLISL